MRNLILFGIHLLLTSVAFSQVSLTMGGDVNFNKNLKPAVATGYESQGKITPWSYYTRYLKPLLNGDLNFANIETVVSDRMDLVPEAKAFAFQTHPEAIKHLASIGMNLMNMANNHTYDFGHQGIQATIESMAAIKNETPGLVSFGVGYKNELIKPHVFQKNGFIFAVASLSIADKRFRATNETPGLIHIWDKETYREMMKAMASTSAHYKILSIHFGTEGQVTLDAHQKEYFEYAIKNGDVDLIIGHHPHAVRPIEKIGDKYIFFSLGNYLMLGSANITEKTGGLDFGLFAKLHLVQNANGRLIPETIELVPLTNTHSSVRPLEPVAAQARLADLQQLGLSELGADALMYEIKSNGRGVYCLPELQLDSSKQACAN